MKKLRILGIVLGVILIFNMVWAWIIYFDLKEKEQEVTKCYDGFSNETIGAECVEGYNYLLNDLIVPTFITILSLLMVPLVCMLVYNDF